MSIEKTISSNRISTKEIVLTAMFTAIITICAWISIPIGPISFTMHTFAVFCAVCILGGRNSFFSVLTYLLLGAVGLPVFAGFKGGIGVLVNTTGGYLLGFLLIPLTYLVAEKIFGKSLAVRIISLIIGLAVCYAFGTAWFMFVYTHNVGAVTIGKAMKWCVTPFVPFDLIKLALAFVVSDRVKKYAKI